MRTITSAKLWVRTKHHVNLKAWQEVQRSQAMRPQLLRPHWRRQARAFELLKARWDKQPSNPTGTVENE